MSGHGSSVVIACAAGWRDKAQAARMVLDTLERLGPK
jgi:hypothetical protein